MYGISSLIVMFSYQYIDRVESKKLIYASKGNQVIALGIVENNFFKPKKVFK